MTFDIGAEKDRVVLPTGAKEQEGVLPSEPPRPTELVDSSFDARSVNDTIRDIVKFTTPERNLLSLAKLMGLAYFVGQVDDTVDSMFVHNMGRIPVLILWSIDLDGLGGQVLGNPVPTVGANASSWTNTALFVRATRIGRYAFFVM